MKRFGFILAGVAALMLMASCEKEVNAPATAGEYALVSVSVSPSVITRAEAGDGTQATDLYAVVYNQEGTELEDLRQHIASAVYPQSVEFKLVKEQTYKIVFLAQSTGAYLSGDAWDMKAITLPAGKLNSDEQDLFTAVKSVTVQEVNQSESVTLTRPFAQVNFACSDESLAAAIAAGFTPAKVKLSFKDLPETYNAVEGTVSGTRATVEYAEAEPYNHAFKAGYKTMAYAYLPVGADSYNTDATLVINDGARTISVTNLPIKANYRTNVLGDFFTSAVKYSVTIDGTFTGATEVEIITPWDGTSTEEVTPDTTDPDVFEISTADELAWVAEQVNSGANTFAGKTVKLVKDIDLNNKNWTPIGTNGDAAAKCFQGTFDGNGKTISNLFVDLTATPDNLGAGLFGATRNNVTIKDFTIDGAVIKNLIPGAATDNGAAVVVGSLTYGEAGVVENVTVRNATVEGNRYVAGIAGYAKGTVKGCTIDGLTLVAVPDNLGGSYDNGDKVGGIIGYVNGDGTITGNTVKNFSIKAYRDMGGIVGCLNLTSCTVSGNTVSNGTITVDQTTNSYGSKTANAGAVVGRLLGGSYDASTNTVENVSVSQIVAEGLTKDGEGNYLVSSQTGFEKALSLSSSESSMNIILAAGDYTLPASITCSASAITINGNDEASVLHKQWTTNEGTDATGKTFVFNHTILKPDGNTYNGITKGNKVTYKDCVFDLTSEICLWFNTDIKNCEVKNTGKYSFHVYAAGTYNFNNVTFNTAKRGIYVYTDGGNANVIVNVEDCSFTASDASADDKAAIMLNYPNGPSTYTLNINNSTATGFPTDPQMWGVKLGTSLNATVNIDGAQVAKYVNGNLQ